MEPGSVLLYCLLMRIKVGGDRCYSSIRLHDECEEADFLSRANGCPTAGKRMSDMYAMGI
jgi:hypothetical protein